MDALATLPVFLKLAGKRAVLAGGTPPAVWKAELLSASGACVDVYAAEPCEDLMALAEAPPGGPIRLILRTWTDDDLRGAAIAIGAIEAAEEAGAFRDAARRHGVPVNIIDNPPFCDFQFGTIVSRSPLVVGISTDGAAPVFGQALRARIEALLPQGLKRWAQVAQDWRPAVQALGLDFRGRRLFWETFTATALTAGRDPDPEDLERCRSAVEAVATSNVAQLAFVGAGTGDPDMITLQAIRALQSADTICHAADLSSALVGFARREATKLPLADLADPNSLYRAVSIHLQPGRRVVWLDKGDPLICQVWQARESLFDQQSFLLERVAGLGMCDTCSPACPAWIRR